MPSPGGARSAAGGGRGGHPEEPARRGGPPGAREEAEEGPRQDQGFPRLPRRLGVGPELAPAREPAQEAPHQGVEEQDGGEHPEEGSVPVVAVADVGDLVGEGGLHLVGGEQSLEPFRHDDDVLGVEAEPGPAKHGEGVGVRFAVAGDEEPEVRQGRVGSGQARRRHDILSWAVGTGGGPGATAAATIARAGFR